MSLLEVRNLKVYYPAEHRVFRPVAQFVRAVDDVSFTVERGETVGLVGESGCGKSTLARAILKLEQPTSGAIFFEKENIAALKGAALRARRRRLQMIFQDPYGSLDPRLTVGEAIGEGLDVHGLARGRAVRQGRIAALLQDVGLDPSQAHRYPHEFSGGQRQRIGIARALALEPKLIVCDEPVSALDVSVQAQIINLLQDLQEKHGLGYLFIAHDLAVVEHISRRILVMYLGKLVETGEAKTICRSPLHPYTRALISAAPTFDSVTQSGRLVLSGELPSPINPPTGCPFHPRCPVVQPRCRDVIPPLRQLRPGHWVSCHLAESQEPPRS